MDHLTTNNLVTRLSQSFNLKNSKRIIFTTALTKLKQFYLENFVPDCGGAVGVFLSGHVLGQGRRDDDDVIRNRAQA